MMPAKRMVFVYQQKVVERHLVTAFAKLADFVGEAKGSGMVGSSC